MLNLENIAENIDTLVEKYRLVTNNNHYLFDGDLEDLFNVSNIIVGETLFKAKDWKYDEDGWLVGCKDGDYLETVVLIQNGKSYVCQVFSDCCGDGLDYMLALLNLEPLNTNEESNIQNPKYEDWIPVSMEYPEDIEDVQVTYLGYNSGKPYCNAFAYRVEGEWYSSATDEEVGVEITAWKRNCEPYKENGYGKIK